MNRISIDGNLDVGVRGVFKLIGSHLLIEDGKRHPVGALSDIELVTLHNQLMNTSDGLRNGLQIVGALVQNVDCLELLAGDIAPAGGLVQFLAEMQEAVQRMVYDVAMELAWRGYDSAGNPAVTGGQS